MPLSVAMGVVALSVAVRFALQSQLGTTVPFLQFVPALMVAAWYGGWYAGLVATAVSAAAAAYWFMAPPGSPLMSQPGDVLSVALFLLIGLVVSRLIDSLRRAESIQRQQATWWQTTLRSVGDGVIVTDVAGRVVFLNSVAATLTGWRPSDAAGEPLATVFAALDEDSRNAEESLLVRVARDGSVVAGGNRTLLVAKNGDEHAIENIAAPIRTDDGRVDGVVIVFRDATKRRDERLRREFLAGATATLTSSLDYEGTLARVAELAVPALGDSCAIFLQDDRGEIRVVASTHVDPALLPAMNLLAGRLNPDPHRGWTRAIREGTSEILAEIDFQVAAQILKDEPRLMAAYDQLGLTSQLTVPLLAHGRALGAMTLVLGPGKRRYDARDLSFAEDVGRVAGVAMDNARLYRDAQRREAAAAAARDDAKFLSDVSALIASSLDYAEIVAAATGLLIPRLADFFDVRLIEPSGELRQVAASHVDAGKRELLTETGVTRRLWVDTVGPVSAAAIRDNRSILVQHIDWETMQNADAGDTIAQSAVNRLRPGSSVVVPLSARGTVIGVMSLFMAESGRRFTEGDQALAEEFARRVTTAAENARLYQQAQDSNRLKDEFLATLSHELRTPLNAVLGWSHMLETGHLDDRARERAILGISRNARAQVKLVEDILDTARGLAGKLFVTPAPLDLVAVVDAAIASISATAAARHLPIIRQVGDSSVFVNGDETRLQQVVLNILANAVKFTPDGGRIDVFVGEENGSAVVRVTDTGIGIHSDFLPNVFERFRQADASFSRAHTGLGLGLAIVRQLVELHGGAVTASSDGEGRGSTFTVRVPLMAPAPVDAVRDDVRTDVAPSLAGMEILLVDDDPDGLELGRALLESRGARVTTAASPSDAAEAIDTQTFNLLILDLSMPGEDGFSFIRRFRAASSGSSRVPAIALSAHVSDAARTRARLAGFDAHIGKPIVADELIRVAAALAAPRFDTID